MAKTITMYICDGRTCKNNVLYCKAHGHKNWLCAHTTILENAKNGQCNEPWRYPERFRKEVNNKTVYFIEKEEKN